MNQQAYAKAAAEKAVEQVTSHKVIGLGSGSTASHAVRRIGHLWQTGHLTGIVGIPTSKKTATLAQEFDIPLTDMSHTFVIDLTIDGADEVDSNLNLIKGLGGALLREKIVEQATHRFVVVVDGSKLVDKLGTRGPLPIEVAPFAWQAHARWLELLGSWPEIRGGADQPFTTDNGNYILDCKFPDGIADPYDLQARLERRAGIVEHGLFLDMASEVIVADAGGIRSLLPAE